MKAEDCASFLFHACNRFSFRFFFIGVVLILSLLNYAPETGQPCYRLQIRNVQGYNEQVVASTRFTMRTTRNADRS
jgi:hypothetical protein